MGSTFGSGITLDPDFAALKRECLDLIRSESLRAFEQQAKRTAKKIRSV